MWVRLREARVRQTDKLPEICCIVSHSVAFGLVIVKFKDLPDHVVQGKTGNRMNMRLRGFSLSYMCHLRAILRRFLVAAKCGRWAVAYGKCGLDAFLFVKSGEALPMSEGCRGLFSEESFMQAEPAHRGMKMYGERRRATTRVAPMTGLSEAIFVPIVHVGCHRHHQS